MAGAGDRRPRRPARSGLRSGPDPRRGGRGDRLTRRLTIVVGTGRCGSTLLSRLLHDHPDVLSLSEFFSTLRLLGTSTAGRPTGTVDGAEFWRLLARPFPMLDAVVAAGLRTAEMAYPSERGRFRAETGVPVLCQYVLPLLTPDPDALFDDLAARLPSWPRRPVAEHGRELIELLAQRAGRSVVIEGSAASLPLVGALHESYPDARFVHLYRDGADCALSMSRHPVFRREVLAVLARRRVERTAGPDATRTLAQIDAALPEPLRGMICPPYDADRLMSHPVGPAVFARLQWAPMIRRGLVELRRLPADSWTSVRYEDLVRAPHETLRSIARFAGADDPARWLDRSATQVDPTRVGAAARLDVHRRRALQAACRPGVRALAAEPGTGDQPS